MIKNNPEIEAVLQSGGTVLVPNRQRAVAVRLAWAHAQLAAGRSSWAAPDVLPLSAWLQRCVDESRVGLLGGWRRLGAHEEWLEWRRAAEAAGEGLDLLQPAALADALREAARMQRDWGLATAAHAGPEGELYQRAREGLAARCRALRAVQAEDWVRLLERAAPGGRRLLLAGFESLGTALAQRLEALGAERLAEPGAPGTPGTPAAPGAPVQGSRVVQARDLDDELQQAARWCRSRLLADPGARLLVVVPQLAQCRARAARAFGRELQGSAMLEAESPEAPFAIEGGQALADYPLVDAALGLLSLAAREQSFTELSAWLRSAYLQLGGLPARVAFELQLREHNVVRARLDALPALARRLLKGEPGVLLAGQFDRLLAAEASRRGARADAGTWAREFADWLACAGWPGQAALGSEEQQQRERCEELLGELAQLSPAAGLLGAADAVALLVQLAQRTPFEAASGDVPVTLTASTSDPLVCYDGIWVAGLSAEQWPRPARPDAFLGVAAQRAAGMPAASAEGQATLARSAMSAWRARSPELVFSCARVDGDAELQPSSLLGLGAPAESSPPLPPASVDTLCGALQAACSREALPAGAATPLGDGAGLPGGTRALGLQAQCPFHAFAELRLAARPLPEPAQGLPARERGVLLHAALQGVWQQLAGSGQLLACQGEARVRLVQAALEAAIAGLRTRLVSPPPSAVLAIESRRQQALILQLLAAEEQRAPFVVAGLEQMFATHIGGVPIDVRMDRVDELLDEHGAGSGHTVVLDYKSGAPSAFDPLSERPTQAQLLAYGLLAPGELAAIAMVHLREARVQWRGATESAGSLPGLAMKSQAGPQWREWRAHWARVVPALAQQLAAGMAPVDPLPGACRTCHLTALCRVGSARHERGRDDAASSEEPLAHEPRDAGAEAGNAGSGDE